MFGLMHLLGIFLSLLIIPIHGNNGGKTLIKSNFINSWEKTIFLSTPLSSQVLWLDLVNHGQCYIIFQQLNTWIMKMVNFQKAEALVFLEIMLFRLISHVKFGDIIYWLTDQKNKIQYSLGPISKPKITMNYYQTLVIYVTDHSNSYMLNMKKKSLLLM